MNIYILKKKKKVTLETTRKKGRKITQHFLTKKNPLNISILESKINDSMPSMYDFYSMT